MLANLAYYSYLTASFAYLILAAAIFIRNNKANVLRIPILITLCISLFWSSYTAFILQNDNFYIQDTFAAESLRNLAWYFFLSILISKQQFDKAYYLLRHAPQVRVAFSLIFLIIVLESFPILRYSVQQFIGVDFRLFIHIGLAVLGLILVEQLYRNALYEQRWAIKLMCLSLAAIFVCDFILYSKSLLFQSLDRDIWQARGFINAMSVPLIAISLQRLSSDSVKIKVSNQVIFHSTVLLGAGSYLVLMSLAGYFIKVYGGIWGNVLQISFIFLAVIFLSIFFISGKIRALAKIYFGKHFFQHRYDYREEWIKLSDTIATLHSVNELSSFIVTTLAEMTDSSGGGLWSANEQGDFVLIESQNLNENGQSLILKTEKLVPFLETKQWLIDFVEYFNDPDIYAGIDLNTWHDKFDDIWLIIPLIRQDKLEAFVILTEPRVYRKLDWQDYDLLKTVSIQLVNALALSKASDDLSRAKQFEAYNRFSAFLVHDLKNLVAQIALIVKNSAKHKHNPEFIDDSIETLENVVKKIDGILKQLKKGNIEAALKEKIDLAAVLKSVVIQQASNKPNVEIDIINDDCFILAEFEKMVAILGHLVQNAQEATPDSGSVKIILIKQIDRLCVKIIDTGEGMDEQFIQQRLFQPFDTTKGNAGMGIGVYEANEYIQQLAGQIKVESVVGKGTTFSIKLPLIE